jgi:hypothetical protein
MMLNAIAGPGAGALPPSVSSALVAAVTAPMGLTTGNGNSAAAAAAAGNANRAGPIRPAAAAGQGCSCRMLLQAYSSLELC